ncbi:unnamed protein product [Mucor hiemalis]
MMEYYPTDNTTSSNTMNTSFNGMINNTNSHPYSSCCAYCTHDEYTFGEDSPMSCSPYLFHQQQEQQEQEAPYKYNYLLSLMTAPDMIAYLSVPTNDDIYALPIHLQRLISEAREEILLSATSNNYTEKSAQLRLERVRTSVWLRSDGDFSILMNSLVELVSDEDELEDFLDVKVQHPHFHNLIPAEEPYSLSTQTHTH